MLVFLFCAKAKIQIQKDLKNSRGEEPENDPVGVDPQNLLAYEALQRHQSSI
jgi:hypothetical protein